MQSKYYKLQTPRFKELGTEKHCTPLCFQQKPSTHPSSKPHPSVVAVFLSRSVTDTVFLFWIIIFQRNKDFWMIFSNWFSSLQILALEVLQSNSKRKILLRLNSTKKDSLSNYTQFSIFLTRNLFFLFSRMLFYYGELRDGSSTKLPLNWQSCRTALPEYLRPFLRFFGQELRRQTFIRTVRKLIKADM